jgi:hypothetical protein
MIIVVTHLVNLEEINDDMSGIIAKEPRAARAEAAQERTGADPLAVRSEAAKRAG